MRCFIFTGTVPLIYSLFTGTVLVNNLFKHNYVNTCQKVLLKPLTYQEEFNIDKRWNYKMGIYKMKIVCFRITECNKQVFITHFQLFLYILFSCSIPKLFCCLDKICIHFVVDYVFIFTLKKGIITSLI